jgi:hypothetical protein
LARSRGPQSAEDLRRLKGLLASVNLPLKPSMADRLLASEADDLVEEIDRAPHA